jgi:hypothetical protein
MTTNTSELYLATRGALDHVGLTITNGSTHETVQYARETVRHAKRMLAAVEIESAERRKAESLYPLASMGC